MPRPDVRDERIPAILDAAVQMFSQFGIDGASMAQIADACGVSKATLYHYFESKDVLILALIRRLFDVDQAELGGIIHTDAPALERLRTYSAELVHVLERDGDLLKVIAECLARAARVNAIQAVVDDYFARYTTIFMEIIQQGKERGEIRNTVNPHEAALAYVSLVEGSLLIALSTGRRLAAVVDVTIPVFLQGLSE